MKILIVDDHPLFRAGFHAVLEQSTLEAGVLSVSSVTEALQTLQRDADIGLVLLDIHLRGDDGFNALKVIGQKFPTTACIMISGDEQAGVASRAVAAGASGFIPKSFTADEMIVAIQKVLAGDVFVPATADLSAAPEADGPHAAAARSHQHARPRLLEQRDRARARCRGTHGQGSRERRVRSAQRA